MTTPLERLSKHLYAYNDAEDIYVNVKDLRLALDVVSATKARHDASMRKNYARIDNALKAITTESP